MKVYQYCTIFQDSEDRYYDVCQDIFAVLPKDGYSITAKELDSYLEGMNNSFRNLPVYEKVLAGKREGKQLYVEKEVEMPIDQVEPWTTELPDDILLFVLKYGLWTKVYYHNEADEEYTHYSVIGFNQTYLLICYSHINWKDGETSHTPHKLLQSLLGKTWFLTKPEEEK